MAAHEIAMLFLPCTRHHVRVGARGSHDEQTLARPQQSRGLTVSEGRKGRITMMTACKHGVNGVSQNTDLIIYLNIGGFKLRIIPTGATPGWWGSTKKY